MEADEGGAYPRDGIVTMGPHEQRAKRGMPRSTLGAFFVGWSLSRSVTYSVMPESMAPPTSMGRRSPDTWGSHTQVPTFASGVLFLHDDSTGKTRGLEKKMATRRTRLEPADPAGVLHGRRMGPRATSAKALVPTAQISCRALCRPAHFSGRLQNPVI